MATFFPLTKKEARLYRDFLDLAIGGRDTRVQDPAWTDLLRRLEEFTKPSRVAQTPPKR